MLAVQVKKPNKTIVIETSLFHTSLKRNVISIYLICLACPNVLSMKHAVNDRQIREIANSPQR